MTDDTQGVAEHYSRGDLGAAILAALRGAGIDPDALSPADLLPLDPVASRLRVCRKSRGAPSAPG